MTPTFCEFCDNVEPSSRKKSVHQWLCVKHKRLEGMGFVSPQWWSDNEPLLRCKDVNAGLCPLFTPIREKQE